MNLLQFFPSYPKIDNDSFYQELYEKREFYELSKRESVSKLYKNHQLMTARFLSPWTNMYYDSLFLIHDTGTGKSASAACLLNTLKNFNPNIKMLYLTNNETLLDNFKEELMKHCPYLQEKLQNSYDKKKNTLFKMERLEFTTFASFANLFIKNKVDKMGIALKYTDSLIILDEVHNLVSESLQSYRQIVEFLDSIPRKKVVSMTATPMRDNVIESIYLLNLVLPKDKKLPTGDNFINQYFNIEKLESLDTFHLQNLETYSWKSESLKNEFKKKIKGYVSVFRQQADDVKIQYIGKPISPIQFTPVFTEEMFDLQRKNYMKSFNMDRKLSTDETTKKDGSFYANSLQATLMVFPDGSWGTAGTATYVNPKTEKFYNKFFSELSWTEGMTNEEQLDIVRRFSTVYFNVIKDILESTDKCVFVYCDKINGSGVLRLINLLVQRFKFSLLKHDEIDWNNKKNRCIFLNETEGKKINVQHLLKLFNDKRNKNGEYIRVIFGTDKTKEGISLKNIQKIHILTPGWNFGKSNQAIGRGVRLYSHVDLEDPKVDIFLHCAVPDMEHLPFSVNFIQYLRSEIKEKNIFMLSHTFLTSAIDCQVNYYNNFRHAEDYSAACFFEKCKYNCQGISKKNPKFLQNGNFNTLYIDSAIQTIIPKLLDFVKEQEKYIFLWNELTQLFTYTDFELFSVLEKIINEPIPLFTKDGSILFLKRKLDTFYFTSGYSESVFGNEILNDFSQYHSCFKPNKNVQSMHKELFDDSESFLYFMETFKKLIDDNDFVTAKKYISSWSFSILSIVLTEIPIEIIGKLFPFKKDGFKYILKINNEKYKLDMTNKTLELDTQKKQELDTKEKEESAAGVDLEKQNPYGFYGIMTSKGEFKIRDVSNKIMTGDTKSKTKGQNCKSLLVDKIIYYIMKLEIATPEFLQIILQWIPDKKKINTEKVKILAFEDSDFDVYFEKNAMQFQKYFATEQDFPIETKKMFTYLDLLRQNKNILCKELLNLMNKKKILING